METKKRATKGITLIALVVTIVVLLILAGVSINLIIGQNGLIKKAGDAKNSSKQGEVTDRITAMLAEWQIEKHTTDGNFEAFLNGKKDANELDEVTANADGTFDVEKDGYILTIKEDGSIVETSKAGASPQVSNLKIGDYVNYTYDTTDEEGNALTYSLPSTKSGYSDQTIAQSSTTLQWIILNIDETTGTIDLVSATPTDNTVTFQGTLGYNNGVYLLNDICAKLYSNSSKGITARSINLEDTEKHFTDKGLAERNKYNNGTATYGSTKTYTGSYSYYPKLYAYEIGSGVNVASKNASSISKPDKTIANLDPYKESRNSPSTSFTVPTTETFTQATDSSSNHNLTVTQTAYYNIAFNDSNKYYDEAGAVLTASNSYWVASRCAICSSGGAYFGLRNAGTYMSGNYLLASNRSADNPSCRLRPVVSLSSSILSDTKDARTLELEIKLASN